MKSKNIPADIKLKSIKEAQNEIKEIIANLESTETNLEVSMDQYTRMMQLNYHIQEEFKKKAKEVKQANFAIATPYPGTKFHEMAVSGEGGMEQAPFEADAFRQRGFIGPVDAFLGHQDDRARQIGNLTGSLKGIAQQLFCGDNPADQSSAFCLFRVHQATRQAHFHGLRFADKARQALCATSAGDRADRDFRLSEFCGVGGDDEIAHHRKLASAAQRITGNRCDDRFAATRNPFPIARNKVVTGNFFLRSM